MAPLPTNIAKYQIRAQLGHGGQGKVYLAYDPGMNRQVAIKVLASDGDPEMLARFRTEAGTTGNLRHKNIVTVYDYGETDGVPYLVMELLEGKNLEDIIASHDPLSMLDRVRIMQQVAEGLHCAHQHAVIHRDVKTSNVMRLADGTVKIMDFGIARVTTTTVTRRTRHGFLIGTMAYMSPEQLRDGKEADAPADIFAYGTVFYELLTGIHPFRAPDSHSTMFRIISVDPPPIKQWSPECPEALERLVLRAMAKERDVRYQSLEDVLLDIEPILLELKQERAKEVLKEVPPLIQANQFESANAKIREVLDLDPRNAEARQARELLQRQTQERHLSSKLESLMREGDAKFSERQFSESQRSFEQALRLRKDDPALREKLNKAISAAEADRNATLLVEEAERHSASGNLAKALERVTLASSIDPAHTTANLLKTQLQAKLATQGFEHDYENRLLRANTLKANQQYELALDQLAGLQTHFRERDEVQQLKSRIEAAHSKAAAEIEETKQANQFRLGLERARQAVASSQIIQARHLLASMETSFGGVANAAALLADLREALKAKELAEKLNTYRRLAREAIEQRRFADAADLANSGLLEFSEDPVLREIASTAREEARKKKLADEIEKAIEAGRRLHEEGRSQDALDLVTDAQEKLGPSDGLRELKRKLQADLDSAAERAAVDQLLDELQALILQDSTQAVARLAAAALKRPTELRFKTLLDEARREEQRKKERSHVDEAISRIDSFEASRKWEDGISLAERVLKVYPGNADLSERLRRVREAQKLDQEQWREKTKRILSNVRLSLGRGELDEAARVLEESRAHFSNEPDWQAAAQELGERKNYFETTRRAQTLRLQGAYGEAETLLLDLKTKSGLDAPGLALLQEIGEERVQKRIDSAAQFSLSGDHAKAIELLSDLDGSIPATLRNRVQEALNGAKKALEMLEADRLQLAELERNKEKRNPSSIIASATQIFDRGNAVTEAGALRNWAQQQLEKQTQEAEAAAARQREEAERRRAVEAKTQPIPGVASPGMRRGAQAKRRPWALWSLGAFVCVAFLAGGALFFRKPEVDRTTVEPQVPQALSMMPAKLANFTVSESVAIKWTAKGGTPPYRWSVESGRLPQGLRLDSATGSLDGVVREPGRFDFVIRVTDRSDVHQDQQQTLQISEPRPESRVSSTDKQTTKPIRTVEDKTKIQKSTTTASPIVGVPPGTNETSPVTPVTTPQIRPEDYNGPSTGTMVWRGDVPAGGLIQIRLNQPSTGNVSRRLLPGIPVGVAVSTPGITVVEPPSQANQWLGVTLKNDSGMAIQSISLSWKRN